MVVVWRFSLSLLSSSSGKRSGSGATTDEDDGVAPFIALPLLSFGDGVLSSMLELLGLCSSNGRIVLVGDSIVSVSVSVEMFYILFVYLFISLSEF